MIPKKVKKLMQKLIDNKFEAYIVGGAVRDYLLNITPDDFDIFTNATGKEILKLFPKGDVIGGEERQKKILTVIVDGVEISQYRSNGDRTETGNSLEEHSNTCDFSINSIAMDIKGVTTDFNCGKYDIENKILRFVNKPLDRIKEDPLRILRGIRFWTKYRGMTFEDILIVLKNIDLLDTLPTERIRDEFMKIIKYPDGITNLWCDEIIYKIFPELKEVVGMKGGDHHDEKVDKHMINSFKMACKITDNTLLRLACFLHDIGKGVTYTEDDGKQTHFYRHEDKGEEMVKKRMEHLKFSNDEITYVTTLILTHMFGYKVDIKDKTYIKFFNKLEQAKIPILDYICLIYCDHQANLKKPRIKFLDFLKSNYLYQNYLRLKSEKIPFNVNDLIIGGKDLIKRYDMKPSPQIGKILKIILELIIDGDLRNNRADIFYYIENTMKIKRIS